MNDTCHQDVYKRQPLLRYTQDYHKRLSIIRKVLVQEKEMFEGRKVSDRIVSIDRHYGRWLVSLCRTPLAVLLVLPACFFVVIQKWQAITSLFTWWVKSIKASGSFCFPMPLFFIKFYITRRSEEHTSNSSHSGESRMPSSA